VMKGATIKHWVRVLPSVTHTIVGMDVLRRVGMAVTWAGELQRGDEPSTWKGAVEEQGPGTSPEHRTTLIETEKVGRPCEGSTASGQTGRVRSPAQEGRLEAMLKNATASAVAKAFENCVALRHDAPQALLSDNGPQYVSNLFYDTLRKYGTELKVTPPYSAHCNPTERQQTYYDKRRRQWEPAAGAQVLIRNQVLSNADKNFCAKLATRYVGPYKVLSKTSPVRYRLQKVDGTGRSRIAHIKDLKSYNHENKHRSGLFRGHQNEHKS
jgi:hypothetical protein